MINVPVSERSAVRAVVMADSRDGFMRRLSDGGHMGNTRSVAGRFSARLDPTSRLHLDFRLDGMRAREQGVPATLLAATNQIIATSPNAPPNFGFFYNLSQANGACGIPPVPPVPAIPQCFGAHFVTDDPRTTWAGGPNFSNLDQWGSSLIANWNLGRQSVRTISAYRRVSSSFYLDIDSSPLVVSETQNKYSYSQLSQEIQVSGEALNRGVKWIGGLYFLREKGADDNRLRFSIADFVSGGAIKNTSFAAFGHLEAEPLRGFRLAAGLRYTREHKQFRPDQYILTDRTGGSLVALSQLLIPPQLNPDGRRILPLVTSTRRDSRLTPSLSATYKPSNYLMAYAAYSEGFKAGGFTQRVFPPEAATPDFAPEIAKSYEVGGKAVLKGEARGTFSFALFKTNYSDMQLIINQGLAPQVKNAGKARIDGFEAELAVNPVQPLRLEGAIGHIRARYTEVSAQAFPVTINSRLPNAPAWTASLAATAYVWKRNGGSLTGHLDWTYRSTHYKDANNSSDLRQRGYGLLGANITFVTPHRPLSLTLGATNLTDKTYLVSGYSELPIQAAAYGVFAHPREIYFRARYTY
jgi:iron complex outermembrane receptor protein